MINIAEFKIGAPDQDGDMDKDLTVEITNTTKETIHQLRCETIIFGHDGGPILFDKETVEETLEIGESTTFSPWGYIKGSATEGSRKDVKVRSSVRLMKRDLIDFGTFEIPLPGEKSCNNLSLKSKFIESDVIVDIVVRPPDEENGCAVEIKVLVKSDSDIFYDNAKALVSMFDKKDSEIDSNYCDDDIPVNGNGMFEVHLYAKKTKLKGANVSVKLDLYTEAALESDERLSEPKED